MPFGQTLVILEPYGAKRVTEFKVRVPLKPALKPSALSALPIFVGGARGGRVEIVGKESDLGFS